MKYLKYFRSLEETDDYKMPEVFIGAVKGFSRKAIFMHCKDGETEEDLEPIRRNADNKRAFDWPPISFDVRGRGSFSKAFGNSFNNKK